MTVQDTLNQGVLRRFLRSRSGIARRNLSEHTEWVADIAKTQNSGKMGDCIDWRIEEDGRGMHGVITCDHPATTFVLEGTGPTSSGRAIGARSASKWVARSCAQKVRHPGTRPNDFLGRALRLGR
ncbi:hypothetical protein AB0454_37150 [Streptomyces sp. NPDC093509]|uniref:hypothetical protein n=1 Tax=Streptomyces sp. NPDC093509 TaxID=3154982 RepID=UPI00344BAF3D